MQNEQMHSTAFKLINKMLINDPDGYATSRSRTQTQATGCRLVPCLKSKWNSELLRAPEIAKTAGPKNYLNLRQLMWCHFKVWINWKKSLKFNSIFFFNLTSMFQRNYSLKIKNNRGVIDLNCMRKVKCYRKTSIMIIIGEHGSR